METMNRTKEFDRLAFTVLAIEVSAQKMNISPSEMRKRLEKVGLIMNENRLQEYKCGCCKKCNNLSKVDCYTLLLRDK